MDEIIEKLKQRKQQLIEAKNDAKPHSELYIKLNERISEIEDIVYLIIKNIGKNKYEQETETKDNI